MLNKLSIRNLAIIDLVELDFASGFTVLTGETGAGKSILIDAIGLAIGLRADAHLVRSGQEKAEISASFELDAKAPARRWLVDNELVDADDPALLVIRRIVYAEGRTRAFVNGSAVNAGQLRELGEMLIEVFGQSESQTLLRADVQRNALDDYGCAAATLAAVAGTAEGCADTERALERLRAAGSRDPAQLEFLQFQIAELEALALADNELEELEAEHRQLAHAGRLLAEGAQAQELLYGGENSVYDQLSTAQSLLDGLVPLHDGFRAALEATDTALAQVRDAADGARRVLERLDLDPQRLDDLERRLGAIHDLARKHRLKPGELPEHLRRLRAQRDEAGDAAGRLEALERQRSAALARYAEAAAKLSGERKKAARRFAEAVTAIVRTLGMPNAQFVVAVETEAEQVPRAAGSDTVRFDFSANPGQPPRALAKVASGGELSRVSLAIQVAALARHGAPTMIFDEVDAGISGGVAEIVGQQLRALGSTRQVMSVTHLAQVAAQGHAHLAIRKEVQKQQTYTRVTALSSDERVGELARMQGGLEVGKAALDHARELLQRAAQTG
ncbi:DNA repair protein RecN [Solimonas terrae]|uniref:DNA repair protein RecN n=1 Tax=Solimonas terrae TaxID=1396819 RepID=A0A6M2BVA0_9GAMM|nr:DNA repair protein RecN [Solimonas terrae]NGY06290.1 DNA repair protein RecN [Solimonas terrae]